MSLFEFSGNWESERYPTIKGTVTVQLPFYITDDFDTELILTYNRNSPYRPGERLSFPVSGSFGYFSKEKELIYILRSSRERDLKQSFMISLYEKNSIRGGLWAGSYTCVHPTDIGSMTVKCETTCLGCIENQPNQLAHMDYDGCLYMDSDFENFDDPPPVDKGAPQSENDKGTPDESALDTFITSVERNNFQHSDWWKNYNKKQEEIGYHSFP